MCVCVFVCICACVLVYIYASVVQSPPIPADPEAILPPSPDRPRLQKR